VLCARYGKFERKDCSSDREILQFIAMRSCGSRRYNSQVKQLLFVQVPIVGSRLFWGEEYVWAQRYGLSHPWRSLLSEAPL